MEKELTKNIIINMLNAYESEMKLSELSGKTISKYIADINQWICTIPDVVTKENLMDYKAKMCEIYKVATVNSKIISVNRYLKWLGFSNLTVKTKRIQNQNTLEKMIVKEDYLKMLQYTYTHNRKKMHYIMKTIAQTGIRIGELEFVTMEAIARGSTVVWNKGKYRNVYFTEKLCRELQQYCLEINCQSGVIFWGRNPGEPITKGAVWKSLKNIAKKVNVPEAVVYPHSFRHLFAKEYMRTVGDISELADILGHSRLETTWIYTKTSSEEKRKRLEQLDL